MAQNEAAIWYFGINAGLDFRSGTPVALEDGQLNTLEGCATISDFNGNLLFYTDGITVWDKSHAIMLNGTGLLGDPSSTQSGIIVPKPGDPNIYYIFTTDQYTETDGLNYSVVDLRLNGGLGDITTKNVPLLVPAMEKVTAVAHANGTDVWVISHEHVGNKFMAYLVTNAGVNTSPVVSEIGVNYTGVNPSTKGGSAGYLKFSPNGELLVMAAGDVVGNLEIFRFNAATGLLSDAIDLTNFTPTTPLRTLPHQGGRLFNIDKRVFYGVEFSPDNKKLYVTDRQHVFRPSLSAYRLYQLDISNYNFASIQSSVNSIATVSNETSYGALQLGIDNKIYIARSGEHYLGVINDPNATGLASDYIENGVSLGTKKSRLGLPPFITSFFNVGIKAKNFCEGDATEFSVNTSEPITSISWDFGDGNSATLETPSHTYGSPGTYTVNVTATTGSKSKTDKKEITIHQVPIANPIKDWTVCHHLTTTTFDLSTRDAEILGSQDPTLFTVSYYPSLADAQNRSNALPTMYTNTLATETIYARIANANNVSCAPVTSFNISVKKEPVLATVKDWLVCDTDTDGLYPFDFTTKNAEILNGQDAGVFSIAYYTNNTDAQANTNPITGIYTNTNSTEEIYFRIYNTDNSTPECFKIGSFKLQVILEVVANTPTAILKCDDDNDGFTSFNLSTKDSEVLGIQSATNFNVSYHSSQTDADVGVNALTATAYTNTTAYKQTIYVRIENKERKDCYNTTSFELLVSKTPSLEKVTDWLVCDSNNDGIFSFDLSTKDSEVLGTQTSIDFNVSYYSSLAAAETKTTPIAGMWNNSITKQEVFYRIESTTNEACFATGSFFVTVYNSPIANPTTAIVLCDEQETGKAEFKLNTKALEILNGQDANTYIISYFTTANDAILKINTITNTNYTNTSPNETLYYRIEHKEYESCYATGTIDLILNPLPEIVLEDSYVICPDNPQINIDGGSFDSWSWKDAKANEIATSRALENVGLGSYSLTVTQTTNGVTCSNTKSFEVFSSGAPEVFTVDTSGFSDRITLVVNATGIGDFEYSIDGENYQHSNTFEVSPGEYTVFVRDPFNCRTLDETIYAIGYQKFFSPNGDMVNDTWNIIGGEKYPNAMVTIYDRYGKPLAQFFSTDLGWDGRYKGRPIPADNYWFKYQYDNGKIITGHFALKR